MTTPLEEKVNFKLKIPATTRLLWQSLMNTLENEETINSWCEIQTLNSLVVTVKGRAAECKIPADCCEHAVRDKLTFFCKEDT